jgi:hypothetical protein
MSRDNQRRRTKSEEEAGRQWSPKKKLDAVKDPVRTI